MSRAGRIWPSDVFRRICTGNLAATGVCPMESLDAFARAKLAALERDSLRRTLVETTRLDGPLMLRDGQRLLSFCCNDYLNLSTHPRVVEAAIEATRRYGVGAGGSRLV